MNDDADAGRRSALVTGASYGIGAAAAVGLAEDGFDVAITDLDAADLAETAERIRGFGRRAVAIALDVRAQDSIEHGFGEAIAQLGRLDVLVNNAAMMSNQKPSIETTRADWERIVGVNLTGTFFMCQQMGRYLIATKRPGRIISVASTHGLVGVANAAPYGISKAAISHMTKMLAIEWASLGIRVNAIAPGATQTKSRAPTQADPARRALALGRIPVGRYGRAEEMAGAIRYLAGPLAEYITGHTLVLDGGVTVQ